MKILLIHIYLVKNIFYIAQKVDMDQVDSINKRIEIKEKGEKRKLREQKLKRLRNGSEIIFLYPLK